MPPQTRRSRFPRFVIERERESESESDRGSEEDEDEGVVISPSEEAEEASGGKAAENENGRRGRDEEGGSQSDSKKKKEKAPIINISLKKVCKVCKGTGHEAGFKGATYIDCPKKPCFLCKMTGKNLSLNSASCFFYVTREFLRWLHASSVAPLFACLIQSNL